jgi:hypothetical protein
LLRAQNALKVKDEENPFTNYEVKYKAVSVFIENTRPQEICDTPVES